MMFSEAPIDVSWQQGLDDDLRELATEIVGRAERNRFEDDPPLEPAAWGAGVEYLVLKVQDGRLLPSTIASRRGAAPHEVSLAAMRLRVAVRYRELLVELERRRLGLDVEPAAAPEEPPESSESSGDPERPVAQPPEAAGPQPTEMPPVSPDSWARYWHLGGPLWSWQEHCAGEWWERGGRGIAKVVTGAGKTVLGLNLIARLYGLDRYSGERPLTLIVVPTLALVDQWRADVIRVLGLPPEHVGVYSGSQKDDHRKVDVMLLPAPSAARRLRTLTFERDTFLIADECHRLGSPVNSRIFEQEYTYTLGLSATPERRSDFGFEEVLVPSLGEVFFEYTHADAVRDGILARFSIHQVLTQLGPDEAAEYQRVTDDIRTLLEVLKQRYPRLAHSGDDFFRVLGGLNRKEQDEDIDRFTALANTRKDILHGSKRKQEALWHVLQRHHGEGGRTLIFHERIQYADAIYHGLVERGHRVVRYHTGLTSTERDEALKQFRRGAAEILVACRALDEGLDVPSVDLSIDVAATSSSRQHIQRSGRVLRNSGDGGTALIALIRVEELEDETLDAPALEGLRDAADEIRTYRYPDDFRGPLGRIGDFLRRRRNRAAPRETASESPEAEADPSDEREPYDPHVRRWSGRRYSDADAGWTTPDGRPLYGTWYDDER